MIEKKNLIRQDEHHGQTVLHSLSDARRLNTWILRVIQPYLGNRIVEVGSGIGNLSRHLPRRERLTLSDAEPFYLKILRQAFRHYEEVHIVKLDLTQDEDFDKEHLKGKYDSVICVNVLEHIQDDSAALCRMSTLLAPGGHIIVLVPQHDWLVSNLDRKVGHYRRYTKDRLASRFQEVGLEMERMFNFNAFGIFGWLINARIFGRTNFGWFQLKVFDSLVPLMRRIEAIFPLPGLSIVGIGRKK